MQYTEFKEVKLMFLLDGNRFIDEKTITKKLGVEAENIFTELGIKVRVEPPGPRGGGDLTIYDLLAMAKTIKAFITLLIPIIKSVIQYFRYKQNKLKVSKQPGIHIILTAENEQAVESVYTIQSMTGTYLSELNELGVHLISRLEKLDPIFKFSLRTSVSFNTIKYRISLFFDYNQLKSVNIGRLYRAIQKIPVRPLTQHEYSLTNIFVSRRDSIVSSYPDDPIMMGGWGLTNWKNYYFLLSRLTLNDIFKNFKTQKEYVAYLRKINEQYQ